MAIQAPVVGSKNVTGTNYQGSAAKVYFTKKIDAEHLIKLYKMINENIFGKVAIKLHTGEKHGPNILPRIPSASSELGNRRMQYALRGRPLYD